MLECYYYDIINFKIQLWDNHLGYGYWQEYRRPEKKNRLVSARIVPATQSGQHMPKSGPIRQKKQKLKPSLLLLSTLSALNYYRRGGMVACSTCFVGMFTRKKHFLFDNKLDHKHWP